MKKTMSKALMAAILAALLILPVGCGEEGGTPPQGTIKSASPSSRQLIGFIGARQEDSDYSIFVMNADGTNHTRLAPGLTVPSADVWSPDRTTLAYLDRDFPSHKYWFSVVGANGQNQRKVTDLSEFLPMSWSWSGDGKKIIMLCPTGGKADPRPEGGVDERYYFDIFSLDLETGRSVRLTDTQNTGKWSPLSSPDGKKIAFSGTDYDPETWEVLSYGIYSMDSDGANRAKLLDSPNPIRSFQWSPDSRKIAYSTYDEKKGLNSADIYVVDVKTGATVNITKTPDVGDMDPSWSPDGKKIASCSGVTRQGYRLRVMNADGTGAADLHDLPDYPQGFPSWSPDGKTILFTDRQSIYSIGADGKNLRTLFEGKATYRDIMFPVWLFE